VGLVADTPMQVTNYRLDYSNRFRKGDVPLTWHKCEPLAALSRHAKRVKHCEELLHAVLKIAWLIETRSKEVQSPFAESP
jgi:DNA-binding response OmpR family regulator